MSNKRFTGECICGHSWEDHHHGMVMNTKFLEEKGEMYRVVDGAMGDECEVDYFEGTPLKENPCECNMYVDKGWIESKK